MSLSILDYSQKELVFFANYAFALTRRVRNVKPFSQGSEIEVQGGAKFARKAINQFSPENAKLRF